MDIEAKLRGLAGIDGLTSLANRRSFDVSIANEWRRATRANSPLSLLMIDIDHFKQYNDSFGHQGGDQCLIIVAQTLADSVCRVGDCAARYGGEEFAVILPNTDEAGVAIVAETIRANIEKRAIRHPLSSVGPNVTVSIGRATVIPKANDNLAKIVSLADMALYQAKSLGRNRVCTSEERLPILERLNEQHPTS
jgi:diguanylate cyclase (GGDEF)-like protein